MDVGDQLSAVEFLFDRFVTGNTVPPGLPE